MNDIQELKNEISRAVTHAKFDVTNAVTMIGKEPSNTNEEYLRKANHNLDIFKTCSDLMEELYLDKDEDSPYENTILFISSIF